MSTQPASPSRQRWVAMSSLMALALLALLFLGGAPATDTSNGNGTLVVTGGLIEPVPSTQSTSVDSSPIAPNDAATDQNASAEQQAASVPPSDNLAGTNIEGEDGAAAGAGTENEDAARPEAVEGSGSNDAEATSTPNPDAGGPEQTSAATPTPTTDSRSNDAEPTPTATSSPAPTPTTNPRSNDAGPTSTATPTPVPSPTPTTNPGADDGQSTASATPTAAAFPSPTASAAATATTTPSSTATAAAATPTPTAVPAPTATALPAPTATTLPTPTATAVPTATATAVPTGPLPLGQPGNWDLKFSDDFEFLDTSKWEPGWFSYTGYSASVNDNGGACFHPDQLSVAGGDLYFAIDPETNPDCLLKDGSQGDYVAGLINSRQSFTFSYGYAEARIYFPSDGGPLHNWPAFWHTGSDWPATGEVDIAEGLSGGVLCSVYHYQDGGGTHQQAKGCTNWSAPGGWHVVAANWEPDKITYYFDGIEVFSTTTGVVGSPHYLIVNYTARRDGSAIAPSQMALDYVRVWQPVAD